MVTSLQKQIFELSQRMRLLRARQEEGASTSNLTDREQLILYLLEERAKMTVSELAAASPHDSFSTMSTTITKLWRDKKLVSKTISPDSQRVTIVELTDAGRKTLAGIKRFQLQRYETLIKALEMDGSESRVLLRVLSRAIRFFDEYLELIKTEDLLDSQVQA